MTVGGDWRQLIRDVLRRCDGVLVDGISARKLDNARRACRVPAEESVIGLVDCTRFGSAKQAVVFTDRAVYAHDRWTEQCVWGVWGVFSAAYHELARLDGVSAFHDPANRDLVRPTTRRALLAVREAVEREQAERVERARVPQAIAFAPDDIGASPEATALQAAIVEAPHDDGPQLVLADLLVAADDPRGELIVLHHRELTDGLRDPDALERYLDLAAVYSFPRAEPEEPPLPFTGTSTYPVRYRVWWEQRDHQVHYGDRVVTVRVDGRQQLQRRLRLANPDTWTPDETAVILRHLGDAIRAGTTLGKLVLPFERKPLPTYGGGPVRSYRVPPSLTQRLGLGPHDLGLAARDYVRWLRLWGRLAAVKAAAEAGGGTVGVVES